MTDTLNPVSNQPYPNVNPLLDLRPYLVNGWRASGSQTFSVISLGNLLVLSMRVFGDEATGGQIAEGIPIRPPYVVRFYGDYNSSQVRLAMNSSGGVFIYGLGSGPFEHELSVIATMPRRAP